MAFWDIFRKVGAVTTQSIVVLLVVNLALGTYTAYQQSREIYREEKTRSEDERREATEKISGRCNIILDIGETLARCLARELEAYEQQANTDKDLLAQQDMAFWAQAVFWITCLGAIISAFGLWFVWQSLRQTRQAILNDREVGHAQVRAYVAVDVDCPLVKPGEVPKKDFKIRNTGQSPAYNLAYIAGFDLLPHPLPATVGHIGAIAAEQDMPRLSVAANDFTLGEALGVRRLERTDFDEMKSGKKILYFFVRVFYEDVFRQKHETSFCGRLKFEVAPGYENNPEPRPWLVTMAIDKKRTYST